MLKLVLLCAALLHASAWQAPISSSRRAVIGAALSGASSAVLLPLPAGEHTRRVGPEQRRSIVVRVAELMAAPGLDGAVAKSKKKAEEAMRQKETAAEARQAMKEYKYAPRPELNDDFTFKEGTVKAGSTGELSGYFKEKGASLQAQRLEDKAIAQGKTAEEAKKEAARVFERLEAEKREAKARAKSMSEDAKRVAEFCAKNKGVRDNVGNLLCP